jgi:hypothetical protein
VVIWLYFFPFWYFVPRKIWQSWSQPLRDRKEKLLNPQTKRNEQQENVLIHYPIFASKRIFDRIWLSEEKSVT